MGDESNQNWIAAVAKRQERGNGFVTLRKSATGTHAEISNTVPKIAVDPRRMSVTHVLVTKSVDLQGDVVEPAGADFSAHESNPVVFYDHRSDWKHPIASASDGANYTVRKSTDGTLVYAETFFNPKIKESAQLFSLVEQDMIRGWSVGFNPKPDGYETIRKSQGRQRGAFHWKQWDLLEYSLTPQPVNPDALTVIVEKGRIGSESLSPMILKSLTAHAVTNRAAIVTVPAHKLTAKKAMPDPDQSTDPAMDDSDPYADEGMEGHDQGETPTVASLYDAAQGIMDICANLEQSVSRSEHKGGKAFAASICKVGQKLAAKIKAKADEIKAELSGEEPDGDEGDKGESDEDGDEVETDDEGGIVTKSGYRPKRVRLTLEHIRKANEAKAESAYDPEQIQALKNQILQLTNRLPAA